MLVYEKTHLPIYNILVAGICTKWCFELLAFLILVNISETVSLITWVLLLMNQNYLRKGNPILVNRANPSFGLFADVTIVMLNPSC